MENIEGRGSSPPKALEPSAEGEQIMCADGAMLPEIAPFGTGLDSLSAEEKEFWLKFFAPC